MSVSAAAVAASSAPARRVWGDPADAAARIIVGTLFLLLAVRIAQDFLQTGRLTGLLLLASELLVVILMVVRRAAIAVDRSPRARLLTALSLIGPPLVRPVAGAALAPDILTALVSAAGVLIVLAGKLSLGRSFGLVPANRGIVSDGLYRAVRHPIYLGYLVTHAAFVVAHATMWNTLLLIASDSALILRAMCEERTLERDAAYRDYATRVRWRLVPGVF